MRAKRPLVTRRRTADYTTFDFHFPSFIATVQVVGQASRLPDRVSCEVAVSSDLVTWQTGTNYVEELGAVPDPNNVTETVTARLVAPFSLSTNQYVTVRVWLRTTGP